MNIDGMEKQIDEFKKDLANVSKTFSFWAQSFYEANHKLWKTNRELKELVKRYEDKYGKIDS